MNNAIYQTIKARILTLEFAPGSILNEKVLAKEFGVSRTPLRGVLNRLESDQLVRVLPRTGILVAEIEFQQIMNTFQVRLGIEEMIGALAAEHATAEHWQRLEEILDQCETLFAARDKGALMAVDREMRTILNEATKNPVLKNVSESLYDHTVRLWCAILDKGDWQEEVQSVKSDLSHTVAVLKSGEGDLGKLRREMLIQHIERISRKFLGSMS